MDWKRAARLKGLMFEIPPSWIDIHYYEAINILFRIENSLRIFVYTVLKTALGKDWAQASASDDKQSVGTIASIAKKRIDQEQSMGYIGYPITASIMQLTAGELVSIILTDAYWPHFKGYFSASKQVIQHKLLEIVAVRNSLSHFRPIQEDDVDLVKQNAKHVFRQIENYLRSMLQVNVQVPSNSPDQWYTSIQPMKNDFCRLSLYESADRRWVKIRLIYEAPSLSVRPARNALHFKVLTVITAEALSCSPRLSDAVIYVAETVNASPVPDDPAKTTFRKGIDLVFHVDALQREVQAVRDSLAELLSVIERETRIIFDDHGAQGKLVRSVITHASRVSSDSPWYASAAPMTSEVKENDPIEYWGEIEFDQNDLVTMTKKYPWMPVTVTNEYESEFDDDIPF